MNATPQDEKPVAEQQDHVLVTKEKLRAAFSQTVGRPATDEEAEKLWRLRVELTQSEE